MSFEKDLVRHVVDLVAVVKIQSLVHPRKAFRKKHASAAAGKHLFGKVVAVAARPPLRQPSSSARQTRFVRSFGSEQRRVCVCGGTSTLR